MFIKKAALTLVATATFTAAAWSLGAMNANADCADQADAPDTRVNPDRSLAREQVPEGGENPGDGSTRELRFAYDEIFDESRSH